MGSEEIDRIEIASSCLLAMTTQLQQLSLAGQIRQIGLTGIADNSIQFNLHSSPSQITTQ